ncbi:hypothetical protein FXO37_16719 [Capsicum annuum]|nr:hypothetical protein FXO37_16719 [Capsicum annuum]
MALHANRSISVSGNKPMDLVSDELPSFSLGLTQDEVFNLGSSNIQPKGGVSSEGARLKHCNNLENIVKKIKQKGLTKPSSPKPPKIQKSMKNTKPDEKGECSKISSPVSSDFESEEEKVEEKKSFVVQAQFGRCIMLLETKESTANVIVIRAKGTNLHFSPRVFTVVTDLNCVSNKDDFVFDEDLSNRLIEDYIGGAKVDNQIPRLLNWKINVLRPQYESLMESMFNDADVKVSFKNIEPTRKEISCFRISKKVVPAGKKLKQQHKGLDKQTPKRTPPPRAAKKFSVRTSIFMPIQQKEKVASKKKDINRSASKKSIPIQSPDLSLCSSKNEDDFISKKVFHKFRNEVLQEMKSICGLVSTRCDEIMNAISEIKKKDKDNQVDNPPMGEADKTTSHHEFTPNFMHDLYKNSKGTLVTEEINGNQSASLMEVYNEDKDVVLDKTDIDQHEARDISESLDKQCDAEKILNPVEFNMDNSKLNQQNQSPIHIHVALTEERKAEQNFSDSQVTIPDELLPSLNAYLNQETSIIVHPLANKVQETSMHVSRIK